MCVYDPYSLHGLFWALGLRVGSLVGPKEFISEVRGTMVSDLGINVIGQRASIAALETKKDWLPGLLKTARKNQNIIKNDLQ